MINGFVFEPPTPSIVQLYEFPSLLVWAIVYQLAFYCSVGYKVKSEPVDQAWTPDREKESGNLFVSQPDALLASDWFEHGSSYVKDPIIMNDAIATLLGDDLRSEYKQMSTGTSAPSQGWGFSSCTWNNMPAVCQMSELP